MRSRLLALFLVSKVLCALFSISSSIQYLCWFVPSSQVQMDGELVVWNRSQTLIFRVEQTRLFWANQTRLFWMDQTRLLEMGQHWLSILMMFPALAGPSSSVLASTLFLPLDSSWWVKELEVSKNYFISAVIIRLPMPIYSEEKDVEETKNGDMGKKKNDEGPISDAKQLVKHPKILLISGLFFCLFSCGIESSFQSQIFTFGLCGPHQLSPQQVVSFLKIEAIVATTTQREKEIDHHEFSGCILDNHICGSIPHWTFLRYLDFFWGLYVGPRNCFSGIALSSCLSPAILILATNLG